MTPNDASRILFRTSRPVTRIPRIALTALVLTSIACNGGLFDGGVGGPGSDDPPQVVFLTSGPAEALPPEEAAAWAWIEANGAFAARQVQMIDLPDTTLPRDAVIWWHYAAEEALPAISVHPDVLDRVSAHLRNGGSALLTLIAASYVVPLRLEPAPPDNLSTRARFVGDGAEFGGPQSRRGHPVLDRFWGGVLSAGDIDYEGFPAAAYSGDRWPVGGRVWAVHQSERGVDPSLKIGVEYVDVFSGGGRVLTLGAHTYFSAANSNRPQLEQLVADALSYLGRGSAGSDGTIVPVSGVTPGAGVDDAVAYWDPPAGSFAPMDVPPSRLPPEPDPGTALNRVQGSRSGIEINRYDDDTPFTLAVPRAVLRGSQAGSIDEFRVHPSALLHDLRFGIVRPNRGVTWLDEGTGSREFTARPEGDELYYNDGELEISLYLTVDRRFPALVGLLAVRSPAPVQLIATWQAAAGEPGVGTDTAGEPRIGWDDGAQAVVWTAASGTRTKAGFGRETATHIIGFDPSLHLDESGLVPEGIAPVGAALDGAGTAGSAAAGAAGDPATGFPGDEAGAQRAEASGVAADDDDDGTAAAAVTDPVEPTPPDLGRVAMQVAIGTGAPAVVPFVVVGGPAETVNVDAAFAELVAAPGRAWVDNARHFRDFLGARTMGLLAPDAPLEDVYRWAKVGIETLRLSQPGIGTAIATGYGATESAGERSLTPNALGGAGALWAAMAADAYGDRELAATTLQLAARYQGIDGRIADAIGAGGRVVGHSVQSTLVFLMALDNHVRTWGDLDLLERLWPNVERAVDFALAVDPDEDGLVDGISRLDRFSTDHAVRTTIHLAGLWGAALEATQRLAAARGEQGNLPPLEEALAPIRTMLNESFWNPNDRRFSFAKRIDGSYAAASTVLPAVPMIFGMLDAGIANAALDSLASAELSHDWGVGLVGEPIPTTEVAGEAASTPAAPVPASSVGLPSPGAKGVSPVFTGWAALAEYAGQRPIAGFTHMSTNLHLLEHGNAGYAVDGYGDTTFDLREGPPHSAASQAMTLLPVVWGMLGIRPDAVNRRVYIRPDLPAGWPRVNVNGVRVGDVTFSFRIRRSDGQTRFEVMNWSGPRDLELHLSTHVPAEVDVAPDPEVVGFDLVSNETLEEGVRRATTAVVRPAEGAAQGAVTFEHGLFPRLVNPPVTLRPGETSSAVRIVRTTYLGGILRIEIEGLPGREYMLTLATPWNIRQVTGVPEPVVTQEAGIATVRVTIPGSGPRYRRINLEVSFAQ